MKRASSAPQSHLHRAILVTNFAFIVYLPLFNKQNYLHVKLEIIQLALVYIIIIRPGAWCGPALFRSHKTQGCQTIVQGSL